MPFDIEKVSIEPLNGLHVLDSFQCAYAPIQNFCRGRLAEAHDGYAIRAFVALHDHDPRIIGFYYLSLSTLTHDEVGREVEADYLHAEAVPTVYLGMLGVDRRLERRGIGRQLMRDALIRVQTIARNGYLRLDPGCDRRDCSALLRAKVRFWPV